MAGHGGGAWKVAYADFVTAMMAFFMVMWIVAQGKPQVKEAVAEYFQDPYKYYKKTHDPKKAGVINPSPTGIKLPHEKGSGTQFKPTKYVTPGEKTTLIRGQKNVEPGKIVITQTHDNKRERVGTMVNFDPQSSELNKEGRELLAALAPAFRGKRHKIAICGHAMRGNAEKQGAADTEWNLTYDRCLAAMHFLISKGVEADRFRLSQAGSYEPLTISGDAANQQKNARVEVYLLDEITEDFVGTKEERAELYQTPQTSEKEK